MNRIDNAFAILFPGDPQAHGIMRPDAEKHRGESPLFKVFKPKVGTEPNTGVRFHPQAQNVIDLFIKYVRRQTVIRNTHPKHTAQYIKGLKDRNLKASQP